MAAIGNAVEHYLGAIFAAGKCFRDDVPAEQFLAFRGFVRAVRLDKQVDRFRRGHEPEEGRLPAFCMPVIADRRIGFAMKYNKRNGCGRFRDADRACRSRSRCFLRPLRWRQVPRLFPRRSDMSSCHRSNVRS